MKIFNLLLLLPLIWLPMTAEAKDAMIDPDCVKSEQQCQIKANRKEAVRQRCIADPEWCKERRYKKRLQMEERRELKRQCKADQSQCAELTRKFKEKQQQLRKSGKKNLQQQQAQWCKDNPAACKKWEAEMRKVREQCQELKHKLVQKFPDRPHKM